MNFQTMSNLAIYEILIALLIGEENEWKEKQKEFMKNVLKLMVYKIDNEKDFIFDLSALTNVISLQSLLKLLDILNISWVFVVLIPISICIIFELLRKHVIKI